MPNARYYLLAAPGRFLPRMIRARMAVMVFTRNETRLLRFTSHQTFLVERTELPQGFSRDTKHETRNTAFSLLLRAGFITMPNARYYLFAEPGRFLPRMIRARMAVMVFTRHETRIVRFTSHQTFLVERTELPPRVFTRHETRDTKHGFFSPAAGRLHRDAERKILPVCRVERVISAHRRNAAPGRFLP